ncbi:hypothetical protein Cfor_07465 [Coptotermes formosanus]|uniref:Nuclear pore complex protein Nup153 n=1 Tax=Coptotermes formosanus TaxID=36987 RepID=A0A6L2PJN4_COPFO|nr:hypothetical protein Cfor_07465 [Coptotermes formosanus]
MVKGNSSLRNKRVHSSKPYDVSNSFVRKVTSRVTNLLPQPSWLSKWFTSSVDNEAHRRDALNSNDSDSEDDDSDAINVRTPPVKRAKIPLNQRFPPNSFKISSVINDQASNQPADTSGIIRDDTGTDGAVAGPSGINTRQLVSSTPNIQSTAAHLLVGTERKMNENGCTSLFEGDDRSESSESTSGCSSLVPQANRQSQASESVMNSLSGRRRSIDEKLNFTCHLQSPRSLLSDRSHSRSPRLHSSVNRRRPSFNVSSFGSLLSGQDKSSAKNNVINSPFYAGRTTYGGASAYRIAKDRSFIPSEVASQKRCGVQVKPVNCASDSLSSMSTTARRILEALEQFSTPVLDAKRIPLESSAPALSCKRNRPHDTSVRPGHSPRTPNSACGLTIPTVPDLLKMRHREKLQDSLEAARLIAASSYPSSLNQEYKLRFEGYDKMGKHGGKIRAKGKELEEDTVEAVNLPNISLPLTSLPKFDFVVPPAATTPAVISTFKFASPITVTENTKTCLPADNYTFSEPLSAVDNQDVTGSRKINCVDTAIANCPTKLGAVQFISGSNSKSSEKGDRELVLCKNSESEACVGIRPATELVAGSVMDILGKKSKSAGEAELKEVSSSCCMSLDKFKPSPGTWECGVCLIRNSNDAKKCAACETPHTSAGSVSSTTVSTPSSPSIQCGASKDIWECSSCHVQNPCSATVCRKCLVARTGQKSSEAKEPQQPAVSLSGFGNKFKPPSDTWECGTCLVRNPDSLKQCQACETKRPVLTAKSIVTSSSKSTFGLGFGDKFKKPPGSWDCTDCMVRNNGDSLKCVACGRARHGSDTQSPLKFNFGIDKAAVSVKESDIASSPNVQSFKFGEIEITSATNFFGVPQACETKMSKLTAILTPVLSSVSTDDVSFEDRFKKQSGTWNCPSCTVQNNNDLLKCVKCEGTRPSSESQSTTKFSFGIDKAAVLVKESSNTQNFIFGETKVTAIPDSMPRTAETSGSAVTTGFNFGNVASPVLTCTVMKPADTSSLPQTGFSFGNTQLSKFQSPLSAEDQKTSADVQKCWSSGAGDVSVEPKGGAEANSDVTREPEPSTHMEQIEEKPDDKDRVTKRVTFSFTESSFPNEESHVSTKTVESAKPVFGFSAASVSTTAEHLNLSSGKPTTAISSFSFTSSQPTFGSSTCAAVTTRSNLFSFGSSTKQCVTFGGSSQQSASTSGSTLPFGTALKTMPTFGFGSLGSSKESVEVTTSSKEMPSFVTLTSTAPITLFGSFTTTTTVSPSLPNFGSATTAPSFSLGARGTIPAFGTPSTSSSTSTAITTAARFSSVSSPDFSTGFATLHEQKPALPAVNKPTTNSSPFTFGASLGQTTPFSFGNMQNEQSLASKGVFSFGAPSTPAASSGFGFASSNQASSQVGPAFTFGSSAVVTSSSEIPSFGATIPASGPVFGTAAPVFGTSNPGSSNPVTTTAATSTPTYNFGSNNSQPTSNLFGFSASQTTGSTNVPVQNFTSPTANFNFGQTQSPAQPSAQPVAPTFDPSIRPSFNFTKGETPAFT